MAGELNTKLEKAVDRLVQAAEAKGFSDGAVAVFPFQTDEKLAKKRVGFAVSELLSQKFFKSSKFKLIERSQLSDIMKEQKLGLSGAVDSETAAKVGKLLGARLLVLGSVSRLGKSYQVNVRLVNVETAEIVAPEIFEVSVKVFDEEAAPYLTLVPERQTLSIQLLINEGMMTVKSGTAKTFTSPFTGGPYEARPSKGDNFSLMGLGLRYFPSSWLVLEGAYFAPSNSSISLSIYDNGSPIGGREMDVEVSMKRLGASYTRKLSQRTRIYAGLMVLLASVEATSPVNQENIYINGSPELRTNPDSTGNEESASVIIPMARLGLEWKPQERFGFALFSNIGSAKEIVRKVTLNKQVGSTVTPFLDVDVMKIQFPAFSIEGAFSFYF
jgi:TolB-like protein